MSEVTAWDKSFSANARRLLSLENRTVFVLETDGTREARIPGTLMRFGNHKLGRTHVTDRSSCSTDASILCKNKSLISFCFGFFGEAGSAFSGDTVVLAKRWRTAETRTYQLINHLYPTHYS